MEIKINNLCKRYRDVIAVDDISLHIPAKGIFALLGVNGAGKTTTIKMLTALTRKDSGKIFYGDWDMDEHLSAIKQIVNLSPQETAIAENLTVEENISFIAELYGFSPDKTRQKTAEIMHLLQLNDVAKKKAKLLSGGMQRRLSIAMAIVTDPKVLFLDEPTLGLDVLARSALWKLISRLKDSMTIILTTHYMEEAAYLADTVAMMRQGKIVAIDSPKRLIEQTRSENLEQAFIKIMEAEI